MTQHETASGNSSGSESKDSNVDLVGERQSTRIRTARTSKSNLKADMIYEDVTSKKKSKKESRQSVESGLSNARNKRRRAVDEELLTMYNPSALEDLLNSMMKHKDGWPFDRPITKADAPDYFDIIARPMDLGTVRTALLCMKYNCNQEVVTDIKQVFENCWTYNREDAEEYQCAVRLEKYFIKEAKKLGIINDNYEASSASNRKGHTSNEETDSVEENLPLAKKARKTL